MAYKTNYIKKGDIALTGLDPHFGTGFIQGRGEVITTNATPTVIATLPVNTTVPSALKCMAQVAVFKGDASIARFSAFAPACVYYNGSTTSFIGTPSSQAWGFPSSAVSFNYSIVGNNLAVNVTGLAGTTINWVYTYEYFSVLAG